MSIILFWYGGAGFVIPRLMLGALLIVHGWPKIRNLKQNAANFTGMGFKPGVFWGTIAALLEFLGGIVIVLGIWVSYASALFLCEFAVIIVWKWIKGMPFTGAAGGWELDALVFSLALMFFTLYGGFFLFPFNGL
jgi:putative oxidoreductase